MKRWFALPMIALLVLVTILPAVAQPPSVPVVGQWRAVDGDGSNLFLLIRGRSASSLRVFLFDDSGTVACPTTAGIAFLRGTGSFDASTNNLSVTGTLVCPSERLRTPGVGVSFDYDPSSDTLTEASSIFTPKPVYTRIGGGP